jgi:hypothetical protein
MTMEVWPSRSEKNFFYFARSAVSASSVNSARNLL